MEPPHKKSKSSSSLTARPDYSRMKVVELRDELKKRGLKCSGNKPDLIERLENDDFPIELYGTLLFYFY